MFLGSVLQNAGREMRKLSLVLVGLIIVVTCATSCRQKDVRSVRIHVPGMKNTLCAEIIQQKLREYTQRQGMADALVLDSVQFDLSARTVTIQYESMKLGFKNIEHLIAEAGFAANEIPANADAAAKLPPECR